MAGRNVKIFFEREEITKLFATIFFSYKDCFKDFPEKITDIINKCHNRN